MLTLDILEDEQLPVENARLQSSLGSVLNTLLPGCDIELELLVTNDKEMRNLNNKHRNIDATTDVLTLPTAIDSEDGAVIPKGNRIHLGTIVISIDQAKRQVGRFGDTLEEEIQGLVHHGLRHLLGYDHDEDGEWKEYPDI